MTDHAFLTACPICANCKLKDRWIIGQYIITRCRTCGFIFVRNEMTAEMIQDFYGGGDDSVYVDQNNLENLNYYNLRLREIIAQIRPPGRILDVGCSSGQFLDTMAGWERYGVEISPNALLAEKKYGANISRLPLHSGQWPNAFFDVITLLDSFDHMPNPLDVLTNCRTLLKPGGLIVVKVHDISSLFARACGRRYYALIPPSHLSYFSPRTLRQALERTGYTPLSHRYIPHQIFIKTIFHRLSRDNSSSFWADLAHNLDGTVLGDWKIRKNVFDIMTMMAVAN